MAMLIFIIVWLPMPSHNINSGLANNYAEAALELKDKKAATLLILTDVASGTR